MASFYDMPPELVSAVADYLLDYGDRASLAATDRRLYQIVNPMLYKLMARTFGKRALFWGAAFSQLRTVQMSLKAGVSPDWKWHSAEVGADVDELLPNRDRKIISHGEYDWEDDEGEDEDWEFNSNTESVTSDDASVSLDLDSYAAANSERSCSRWLDHIGCHLFNWTALHLAAREGNLEIVATLLDYQGCGLSLADAGSQGFCLCERPKTLRGHHFTPLNRRPSWRPLHVAICHEHWSAARLLLSRGAPVALEDQPEHRPGITALHQACQQGSLALAQFIVDNEYQTDLDERDGAGQTPLVYAYLYGHWDCFEWLLGKGARLDAHAGTYGSGCMLTDACNKHDFQGALRLLNLGVKVNARQGMGTVDPLHALLAKPWTMPPSEVWLWYDSYLPVDSNQQVNEKLAMQLMRRLLDMDLDVNDHDRQRYRETPLALAVRNGITCAVGTLLAAGANTNTGRVKPWGTTILHEACRDTRQPPPDSAIVSLLLEHGADVNATDADMRTPLMVATETDTFYPDRTEVIRLLLDHGAEPGHIVSDRLTSVYA